MRIAILSLVLFFAATPAGATLFKVNGTFAADEFFGTQQAAPVNDVSGSFEFFFDDTTVTGPALILAPSNASAQVGTATFDETNTEVILFFDFSGLTQVWWGGTGSGATQVAGGTDDISAGYFFGNQDPFNIAYSLQDELGVFRAPARARSGTLIFTVVPEPSTAAMMGLGLLALASRRRKRA